MSSFWNFAFGALLVIIWIIAGGFITQSNVFLGPYKNTDNYLHDAYWYSFWAAFVTWTLIGIFIILVILSVIGVLALFGSGVGEAGAAAEGGAAAVEGTEVATAAELGTSTKTGKSSKAKKGVSTGISWITIGFLAFALILVAITGILSALTASSMVKSPNYDPTISKLKTAYTDAIVAASISLGAGGLLIIGIIVYFIVGEQRKKKIEAQKELAAKERALELHEIQQLKVQSIQEKAAEQAVHTQELQQAQQAALVQKVYQQAGVTPPPTTAVAHS